MPGTGEARSHSSGTVLLRYTLNLVVEFSQVGVFLLRGGGASDALCHAHRSRYSTDLWR